MVEIQTKVKSLNGKINNYMCYMWCKNSNAHGVELKEIAQNKEKQEKTFHSRFTQFSQLQ